ncbi:transporter substrate-binding protein [Celeribacter neptunius]|uniref:Amino acid/amide ABC transporter substrate-binding protein, HAAT family (TC 3.A.1.4.-) n=1 Tax=Celeribacter neptunius TaxID=588602 RepID=A0A1I3P0T1_9RHOB|nr:transporter substrate-binding protein [Celeribacter neptunius]SFJ15158.1 amino acid/amide ABC transporter substrate-binding protein, HAAT family (TC 3.A.1.4.-) [Celeribacter neptunius]
MKKRTITLGLLYSRTGTYSLITEACRIGVMQAIAEVNADPDYDMCFRTIERDPGGNADAYGALCEELLQEDDVRHVFGCVTSWSRKEVIPVLEKTGGTLWYSVPYEGFEASDRVVYGHACPNQHLLPLMDWVFGQVGKRGYLTGSNYIWGWEMNRLAREVILARGGEVLGERYLPLGRVDVERVIEEIRVTRPNFVLNSLIGPSQYAFLEAYAALGREDPHFTAATCPVLSCNLTECELPAIPAGCTEGLVAAGPYFRGETGWPKAVTEFGSSHEAASWAAVHNLARLLNGIDDSEKMSLAELLEGPAAAQTGIDPVNHHKSLPSLIAQVENDRFVTRARYARRAGDPYLANGRDVGQPQSARLKVVK